MGMDGGINIIILKHSEDYLLDLLGPFYTSRLFNKCQKGSRAGDNSRWEFAQSYQTPKNTNLVLDVVGDDVDENYCYSAIPEMASDLESMIEIMTNYFPQDKKLLQKISWKEFITNLTFFFPTWDVDMKYSGISLYWLNRKVCFYPESMSFLDVCRKHIEDREHEKFFNIGLLEWCKLVKEEFISVDHYQTWT